MFGTTLQKQKQGPGAETEIFTLEYLPVQVTTANIGKPSVPVTNARVSVVEERIARFMKEI